MRVFFLALVVITPCSSFADSAQAYFQDQTNSQTNVASATSTSTDLKQAVVQAFAETHQGWSSDEVILNDELHNAFLARCKELHQAGAPEEFSWTLLNLRKAGKLTVKATKRKRVHDQSVIHVAEIAARAATDRFKVSTDRIMVSPTKRAEFNRLAQNIDPNVDLYLVRRAAFRLRKTRKLQPELITRIVDWDRKINSFAASEFAKNNTIVPEHPGIYIFRDKSGYLYIGQSENLRARLIEHLDDSHSQSLSSYLKSQGIRNVSIEIHAFAPNSRAKETRIRRAYESELIASRKPRFNIQP